MENLDSVIAKSKVIVCAGSGGVGKTTISSAIGVRAAQMGKRTLVLTVDPAKRLATALGLDLSNDADSPVPLTAIPGTLSAAVIDSKKTFDRFITTHAKGAEIVDRIMQNRLYQQLSTTLAGSQEFTALERLLESVESKRYDLVVLDTPPTQHAMDFLTAPHRIAALFQDATTKWFAGPDEKPKGFISGLIGRGTRIALKSLEVLTGGQFIEELVDFFAAVRSIQDVLRLRSQLALKILMDEGTSFILVTSFDAAKLAEAGYLQRRLQEMNYHLRAVVINRAFPNWLPEAIVKKPAAVSEESYEKVLNFFAKFKDYYAFRYTLYDDFAKSLPSEVSRMRIPDYHQDIHGLEDLEALATVLGGTSTAKEEKPDAAFN